MPPRRRYSWNIAAEWHCSIMQPFFTSIGCTRCTKNMKFGSFVSMLVISLVNAGAASVAHWSTDW